jgi:hypothetical protein
MNSKNKSKICTCCNQRKNLTEFYTASKYNDRLTYWCKICIKNKNHKAYCKNKEERKRLQRIYTSVHKKQISINKRRYYKVNINKIKKKDKLYYKQNKSKIIKRISNYERQKLLININFKLIKSLRNRLYLALKNNQKQGHTLELLGCSIDKLKRHLEKQFTQGMSWGNYGKWHIDHIKPCAKFDLSNPKEQQKCFHYTNLQPLWAIDNIKKGIKIR